MSEPGVVQARYLGARQQRVRPSGWWIVAGVLVAVAGVVGAIVFAVASFLGMRGQVSEFQRTTVPGSTDVRLAAGHDYTIYFEHADQTTGEWPTVTVTLTDPVGRPVELRTNPHTAYQLAGRDGEGEFDFRADQDGAYHLTGTGGPGVALAVGPALAPSIARTVLGPLLFGALGFVVGVAIIVTTVALRGRYRPPMPATHRQHR